MMLIKYIRTVFGGLLLASILLSGAAAQEVDNFGLTSDDINFISQQSLVYQYKKTPYKGNSIDPDGSYSASLYARKSVLSERETISKRLDSAVAYRERGDIERFSAILLDVITRNNFNEEAALSALMLGEFEYILHNLEESMKFFRYVVNVHYYSSYGLLGAYKLAIALDRNSHWDEAEELLVKTFEYKGGDGEVKSGIKAYLSQRYLEWARWNFEENDMEETALYYKKYKDLQ